MTIKEQVHALVEQLPESDAVAALDYLQWLLSDEDELTPDEWEAVRLGEAEIARGDYVTLEELKRDLGR